MNPVAFLETGVIHRDDCLNTLRAMPDECIDLIYLDPPFFSNRNYQVVWGEEAEMRSFDDKWEGGMHVYIDWMEKRAAELYRVLKRDGSLYFHCDWHASHYVKVMLDGLFALNRFRNEIIWKRTTAHSSAKRFAPIHDTILYYSKSPEFVWNEPREAYDEAYLDRYYKYDDGDGRLYWRNSLTAAGTRRGPSGQPWRGIDVAASGQHWKFTPEKLDELDKQGRIYWPSRGRGFPQIKRYRDELKGKAVADIWVDVDRINPVGSERVGYPTQKPEALLERIIRASTDEAQIVLDPFCGCGTTIAVAHRLRRQWIGIDISPTAAVVMKHRLNAMGASVKVERLPVTPQDLKELEPLEFQNWIIRQVNGSHSPRRSGDMGIDGFSFFEREPIQVKQSERVGRNVVDNFETAVRRHGSEKGYLVAFSFTRGAIEEAARTRLAEGPQIVLVKVEDVGRLGELAEIVVREQRVPDLSQERTPDVIGILGDLQKLAEERKDGGLITEPPPTRPAAKQLSDNLRRGRQQRLRV